MVVEDDFFFIILFNNNNNTSFKRLLSIEQRRRRDRRIPRIALVDPSESAWVKLYCSGSDSAMITLTGLDYPSFNFLSVKFEELYSEYTPYSSSGRIILKRVRGRFRRPRSLDSRGCLALVLSYNRTRGSTYALSLLFGVTGTVLALFLKFGRRLLLKVLKSEPGAKVQMPSLDEIEQFKSIVIDRYPSLEDAWCVMDGVKLLLETSGSNRIQECFYNGWTHDHYVSNVFVFSPAGVIATCSINNPGCMHDSQIAEQGGVYAKLEMAYNASGGKAVVDSAFARGRYEFLIKSCQTLPSNAPRQTVLVNSDASSLRQSSEWGMRGLQASFPRIKDRFIYEENGERLLILLTVVHLFNFRTRYVGLNQIRSVFLPQLELHDGNTVLEWANLV